MYIRNETEGKRGSAEIASCLKHYFDHFIENTVKKIRMFSDNCSGQNKNINVVLTCLQQIHSGKFTNIEHYFMIPGHSYMPCDRDFGNITQKLIGVEVFSTPNYIEIIRASRKTRPFITVNMNRNLFFDIELLQKKITNRTKTLGTFSKGKVFLFDEKYKQGFSIKPSFTGTEPVKVNLQKGRKQTYDANMFNLSTQDLPQKYVTPIKLDLNKLKDLQDLLEFIPSHHRGFMNDLIAEQQALGDVSHL